MTKYNTKVDLMVHFANGEVLHLVNYLGSEKPLELVDAEVTLYSLDETAAYGTPKTKKYCITFSENSQPTISNRKAAIAAAKAKRDSQDV